MKNLFPGHFPLSENELSELMQKAIFVLDTNVLLNMYRYTEPSREHFLEIIEKLGNRVVIPYQVACEFFDARTKVIQDQNKAIDLMDKAIDDAHKRLKNDLNQFRKHAHVDIAKILGSIGQTLTDAQTEIRRIKENRSPVKINEDPILHRLAEILAENVRNEPTQEEIEKRKKAANERIKLGNPPGFMDKDKSGDKSLGDVLIWLEIIDSSEERGLPVVFVTDDVKEDWWLRVDGQLIGPLPALRQEFHKATGHNFHMYQAENFIKHAAELVRIPVDEETLSEAAKVSEDQAKAWNQEHIREFSKRLYEKIGEETQSAKRSAWISAAPIDRLYGRLKDADEWRKKFDSDPGGAFERLINERLILESPPPLLQRYFLIGTDFTPIGPPKHILVSEEAEAQLRAHNQPIWVEELGGHFAIVRDSA